MNEEKPQDNIDELYLAWTGLRNEIFKALKIDKITEWLFNKLIDMKDLRDAKKALKEKGEVSWADVKKNLK